MPKMQSVPFTLAKKANHMPPSHLPQDQSQTKWYLALVLVYVGMDLFNPSVGTYQSLGAAAPPSKAEVLVLIIVCFPPTQGWDLY